MSQKKIRSQTQECKAQETAHTIGDRIKMLRKQKGLTQVKVAMELSVDHSALSKWENGHANPDYPTIKNLAIFFGVTLEYLLNGEKEDPNSNSIDLNGLPPSAIHAIKVLTELVREGCQNCTKSC